MSFCIGTFYIISFIVFKRPHVPQKKTEYTLFSQSIKRNNYKDPPEMTYTLKVPEFACMISAMERTCIQHFQGRIKKSLPPPLAATIVLNFNLRTAYLL